MDGDARVVISRVGEQTEGRGIDDVRRVEFTADRRERGAGADLNRGFGTFRDRDRREIYPAPVHSIFSALEASERTHVLEDADVVTWRGNMSKLLTSPWNLSESWTMEAELVNNRTIVLNVKETEEGLRKALTRDERDERMCYWGYAFEEAVCSERPFEEPVDCMECFCCVVKTKLGDLNVVMCGEVDCVDGDQELANYVELKTSRVMNDERQVKRFEKEKLLKWWAQSFALGVRRIMVGFRDDRGKVVKTQMLETLKLPGYVAKHKGAWNVKVARCASVVLTKLKELLSSEPSGTRVRVEFDPKKSKDRVNIIKDDSIPDFLPAEAREKLLNGGSWHERLRAQTDARARGFEARDSAPEISETASAMSIRARTEVTNRIDYIRSSDRRARVHARQRSATNASGTRRRRHHGRHRHGSIGVDATGSPRREFTGHSRHRQAHKMAPTASAGKAQSHAPSAAAPSSSGVRDAKSAAEDNSLENSD